MQNELSCRENTYLSQKHTTEVKLQVGQVPQRRSTGRAESFDLVIGSEQNLHRKDPVFPSKGTDIHIVRFPGNKLILGQIKCQGSEAYWKTEGPSLYVAT